MLMFVDYRIKQDESRYLILKREKQRAKRASRLEQKVDQTDCKSQELAKSEENQD